MNLRDEKNWTSFLLCATLIKATHSFFIERKCSMVKFSEKTKRSGEILAFDDNDQEITRCVVEQWIDNKDEDFYDEITGILRSSLKTLHPIIDAMGILKPFSFVLENDDKESIAELYVADDETIIIDGELMEGLDKDLDTFLDNLLKE